MKRQTAKPSATRAKPLVDSKPVVREDRDASERTSMLLNIFASPFALKRRSNPSAAFAEMMHTFSAATQDDDDVARAFDSFQKNFKGIVLRQEDAIRLDVLMKRGADRLGIKVGSLPCSMGPGLAFMYDAALERLRSSDEVIFPDCIGAREIRIVERNLERILPLIGSMSVTALELALDDKRFGEHLRQRGADLETMYLNDPPGPCEHCVFTEEDRNGNVIAAHCGTKEECDAAAGMVFIWLLLLLGVAIFKWLF